MKVFHIDQFKCTICSNWFCPPYNLPYRLKCTHSICTNCLQKSVENKTNQIICPQDLQRNKISEINVNQSTKKALERLLKQHKNFTQTNHLQCIKSLSLNFDQLLDTKQIQLKNLSTLIDQIFENQIKRLKQIYEKIKIQINRPFRIVNDWKQVVRNYLKKVKTTGPNMKGCVNELNHYIEQGRKIKLDLNQYLKYDFRQLIDVLLMEPQISFTHSFSIFNKIDRQRGEQKFSSLSKFQTLGKKMRNDREICLQDVSNNLDQSSIRMNKQSYPHPQINSNKMSLFEQLIQQTPKNNKSYVSHIYQDTKKTPLKEMMFSSANNIRCQDSHGSGHGSNQESVIQIQNQRVSNKRFNNGNPQAYRKNNEQDYNQVIKEKIKKLKTKQTIQKNSNNKNIKMGKSLQYSPDQVNCNSQIYQQYAIHDSFEDDQQKGGFNSFNKFSLNKSPNFSQQNTTLIKQCQSLEIRKNLNDNFTDNSMVNNKKNKQQQQQQQMLLDQRSNRKLSKQKTLKRNNWQLQNMNFLKQWKINRNPKQQQQLQIIQKYGHYDSEKEKNKYIKKIEENKIKEIMNQINITENYISLVGHSLNDCNLTLLLSQINWNYRNIQIVKFIKTNLSDSQLNQLLNFLLRSNVHTLMLSYNNLSQLSLDALLNFIQLNHKLKNVYLPKNNISLLKGNARAKMNLLKQKGINLYL